MNSELYYMGSYFIVLIVLIFILVEAISIRNNREEKFSINCFSSIKRFFTQKKGVLAEDFIAFSILAIFAVFGLLFYNFGLSFDKGVLAERKGPVVMSKREIVELKNDETVELIESREILDEEAEYELNELEGVDNHVDVVVADLLDENSETELDKVDSTRELFIKTYDESVFASLPATVRAKIFVEFEDLHLLQGNVQNISDEKAVVVTTDKNEVGDFVLSDPTLVQPAGEFEIRIKTQVLNVTDFQGDVFKLAVIDEHSSEILLEKTFTLAEFKKVGEWGYLKAKYSREFTGSVQVRGYYLDKVNLAFDKFEIIPVSLQDVQNGVRKYSDILDSKANNGKARVARFRIDLPGRMVFGPYDKDVQIGQYLAKFRLKLEKALVLDQNIALIDVSSDAVGFVPVYKFIKGQDFNKIGEYQNFELKFNKSNEGYLEFRIYYYGNADLYFDEVDLFKIK
jgi:hypothetical protein